MQFPFDIVRDKSRSSSNSRTTKITLEDKLQSCLELRIFQNPFDKDKSVGL